MAVILATGFIQWNLRFGRESTIHAQLGHIQVFRPGYRDFGKADPFAYLLPDDAQTVKAIEDVPHLVAVAPRLNFNGLISRGDFTISFLGEGVAPRKEALLSRSLIMVSGQPLEEADALGVILGEGLAQNLGAKVGDTVVLLSNGESGAISATEAHVRGIFRTITKAYDDVAIRTPIAMARELIRVSGSHSYVLLLDSTDNTNAVLATLKERFNGRALEFVPWQELADFYNKTSALFSRQMAVLRVMIAVIIVLGISNSMMRNVLERTAEIGTAMALGTRRRAILGSFLIEGTALGAIGALIGAVMAVAAALLISAIGIPMPAPPGMAFGYRAGIALEWQPIANALLLGVGTTVVASAYPAWKASRLQIVDALRRGR